MSPDLPREVQIACCNHDTETQCIRCVLWDKGGSWAALGIIEGQTAERAAVVTWLRKTLAVSKCERSEYNDACKAVWTAVMEAIERGDHLR